MSRTPFQIASFVLNYVRHEFDGNDENERVAYFELISGIERKEIEDMISTFHVRKHWATNDYEEFVKQLHATREKQAQERLESARKKTRR